MNTWAIVPFKGTQNAKRRLANDLSANARESLVRAMLDDVLQALSASSGLDGILLVSKAPEVGTIATRWPHVTLYAEVAETLVGALIEASERAKHTYDADRTIIVPGDVPLITSREVEWLLNCADDVVIVPDSNRVGTNALVCKPPNAFPYVFDGRSFVPHLKAAELHGLQTRTIESALLGIDVDTTEDLEQLLKFNHESHTRNLLLTHPEFTKILDSKGTSTSAAAQEKYLTKVQ